MKNSTAWYTRKSLLKLLLVVIGAVLFVACSNQAAVTPTATPVPPTATPSPTPEPTATPIPPTPTPEPTATPVPTAAPPTVQAPTETPTSTSALNIVVSPGSPPSEDASFVAQLFEDAAAAIQEVQSFHFELKATIEGDTDSGLGDGGIPISLVGDFQSPDRIKGKMEISLGFFEFEIETISIGDTSYVTNPQTGEWELAPGPSTGLPNPADLTGFGGDALEGLTLISEEVLDGVAVYHLRGVPPQDAFGSSEENPVQADFWIGIEDSLFRRITASGDISLEGGDNPFGGAFGGGVGGSGSGSSEPAKLEMTMTFSNYNEPVTIEPPDL